MRRHIVGNSYNVFIRRVKSFTGTVSMAKEDKFMAGHRRAASVLEASKKLKRQRNIVKEKLFYVYSKISAKWLYVGVQSVVIEKATR